MQTRLGWDPIVDAGRIIGLGRANGRARSRWSLAANSNCPARRWRTIHQTCKRKQCSTSPRCARSPSLWASLSSALAAARNGRWPKRRACRNRATTIITRYMPKVGTKGLDMMYRTCTIQVNLDFSSEEDMRRKMQVSLKLQPLSTALFAKLAFHRRPAQRPAKAGAAISGATPTTSGPACSPSVSRLSSALPTMWNGRSTCRCISSFATAPIRT